MFLFHQTAAYFDDAVWMYPGFSAEEVVNIPRVASAWPWAQGEPQQRAGEECAVLNASGLLEDVDCATFAAHVVVQRKSGARTTTTTEEL